MRCPACGLVVYAKSAPTASALVLDARGRVLLGRRAIEPYLGCWDTPGGFLDEGEDALDALRRELREETGLDVEPLDFFAVTTDRYGENGHFTLNLYWTARAVAGELIPADDVAELRWFAPDELPPREQIAFANVHDVLTSWARAAEK